MAGKGENVGLQHILKSPQFPKKHLQQTWTFDLEKVENAVGKGKKMLILGCREGPAITGVHPV